MQDENTALGGWPLTPRTVAHLVSALDQLSAGLDMDQATMLDVPEIDVDHSFAVCDFPRMTWRQPREWWREVMKSADRVRAGLDQHGWYRPRTPAEEAVIHVAVTAGWLDVAQDEDDALRQRLEQLPDFGTHDFDWEEVLPSLTGDADIELLWSEQMDGIEDPDNDVNQVQGIGDYRSQSWHRIFAGRLPPEDDE